MKSFVGHVVPFYYHIIVVLLLQGSFLIQATAAQNCIEVVQNGGFENGFTNWETMVDADMFCEIGLNDGTVAPFPGGDTFIPAQPPIMGMWDAFTQTTNPGACKLAQTVTLPPTFATATLSWKDRIFSHLDQGFVDGDWPQSQEARVRVCLANTHDGSEIAEIWSTNPGENATMPGPNVRSYDVTSLLQGKTSVKIMFEQADFYFFFNSYWDQVSLQVCMGRLGLGGGGVGDPHFQTWHGQWYDFHGLCDLVLIHSEEFGNGIGLDIHLRTKARSQYSYIEAAAIRIGTDILVVGSWGEYWFNGVEGADLSVMGDNFPVVHSVKNTKSHRFIIKTGSSKNSDDESIVVKVLKDMVSVTVENATFANFGSSVGLMGNYVDGTLLTRRGSVTEDPNLLGQSWQVLPSEPQLFLSPSDRPWGTCYPQVISGSRRLEEETIQQDEAEQACAHFTDEQQRSMCVFDVIAMGDLEMADAHGAF